MRPAAKGGVFLLEPGGFEQPFRLSQFVVFDAWTGSKQSQKGKDKFQFGHFFQYRCDQTRRTPGCFAEGIQGACHVSGLGDWGNSRQPNIVFVKMAIRAQRICGNWHLEAHAGHAKPRLQHHHGKLVAIFSGGGLVVPTIFCVVGQI